MQRNYPKLSLIRRIVILVGVVVFVGSLARDGMAAVSSAGRGILPPVASKSDLNLRNTVESYPPMSLDEAQPLATLTAKSEDFSANDGETASRSFPWRQSLGTVLLVISLWGTRWAVRRRIICGCAK